MWLACCGLLHGAIHVCQELFIMGLLCRQKHATEVPQHHMLFGGATACLTARCCTRSVCAANQSIKHLVEPQINHVLF